MYGREERGGRVQTECTKRRCTEVQEEQEQATRWGYPERAADVTRLPPAESRGGMERAACMACAARLAGRRARVRNAPSMRCRRAVCLYVGDCGARFCIGFREASERLEKIKHEQAHCLGSLYMSNSIPREYEWLAPGTDASRSSRIAVLCSSITSSFRVIARYTTTTLILLQLRPLHLHSYSCCYYYCYYNHSNCGYCYRITSSGRW